MGRLDGKVAFITGAGRGQGRSHAVRFAEEGADIIATDICARVDTVSYAMSSADDLAETVALVEKLDRRIIATQADVRDYEATKAAVDAGVAELGRLDIICGNAGIASSGPSIDLSTEAWREMIDINLTGVWHTCKAAIPHIIAGDRGGSIILTSSTAGIKGFLNLSHYAAAKHGVVGLMRSLANELAPHRIRVNTVHPTTVSTAMVDNPEIRGLFRPDLEAPTLDDAAEAFMAMNMLPVPWVEASDITNAVLFLASDEARYITGASIPIDAGATQM